MKKKITYIALGILLTSGMIYNIYYIVDLKKVHAENLEAIEYAETIKQEIQIAKEKNLECTEYVSQFGDLMHGELYPKQDCGNKNVSTTNIEERVNCDEEYITFRKAK